MTKIVTAGILLIGDELLSGRTKDTNLSTIATFLGPLGVHVKEGRILPDDKEIIIKNVRDFSQHFDYVFTTGGIGPTHDDITAECIADAFGVGISQRADAIDILKTRYSDDELNDARLRMARIPDGASLIANPVSQAPGFQTRNVFTMAGVPRIMRAMLEDIPHRIEGGQQVLSISIDAPNIGEGDAAGPLSQIADAHPDVSIGSYPFYNKAIEGEILRGVCFVARSPDEKLLSDAEKDLKVLVETLTNS